MGEEEVGDVIVYSTTSALRPRVDVKVLFGCRESCVWRMW